MAHDQEQDPQHSQQWPTQPGQPYFQPHFGPPPDHGYAPPQPPKKSNTPLVLIVIGVVALLVLGGLVVLALARSNVPAIVNPTAPVAEPTTLARLQDETRREATTAGLGDTLTLSDKDINLELKVTVTNVFDRATAKLELLKPKPGYRLVAIELRLENTGQVVYDDLPSAASKLIDDQGQQYEPSIYDVTEGVSLKGGVTVTAGDRRKGVIVFELPTDFKPARFQFTLRALGYGRDRQTGEWVLIK